MIKTTKFLVVFLFFSKKVLTFNTLHSIIYVQQGAIKNKKGGLIIEGFTKKTGKNNKLPSSFSKIHNLGNINKQSNFYSNGIHLSQIIFQDLGEQVNSPPQL